MSRGSKRPDGHTVEHGVYLMSRADRIEVGRLVETGRMTREAAATEYGVSKWTVRYWQRGWRAACSEKS